MIRFQCFVAVVAIAMSVVTSAIRLEADVECLSSIELSKEHEEKLDGKKKDKEEGKDEETKKPKGDDDKKKPKGKEGGKKGEE